MVWGSVRLCGIAGSVFCGRARLRAIPRTSGSLPGLCHERPAVSRMDADDEFGDLYADIGGEAGRSAAAEAPLVGEGGGDLYDEDDEELLYGKSSSLPPPPSLVLPSKSTPAVPENGGARQSAIQLPLPAVKEVDNDELFLYGQLYGDSSDKPVDEKEEEEDVAASLPRPEKWPDPRDDGLSAAELAGGNSSFDLLPGIRASGLGKTAEIPLGAVGMVAPGSGEREANVDGVVGPGRTIVGLGSRGLASNGETLSSRIGVQVGEVARHANSPPGLAVGRTVGGELLPEDEEEGQELVDDWEGGEGEREQGGEEEEGEEEEEEDDEGAGGGVEGEGEEEENWESDSEDDLQIVLNEEGPTYAGERPADGEVGEGSEDEDEDLVIVTGDDDAVPVEEQEWEEQALPLDALPGTTLSSASDRAPGSEDRGQSGGPGMSSGVPRIGYSGQGYHAHHMQYKYVRPGAGGASGSAPQSGQGSPQAGVSRSGGAWGSGRGLGGRGDWSGDGGRGSSGHRSQGGGGMMGWGSGRGFPSGLEFSLPPTKTVFDVDLDSLEEKPWRRPGVDVTDYFNFNFSESSWKQYCRQLAQLRLEATMQSKIRVYESGRSEQDFDPDLPPELAAATGMHEAYSEPGGPLQRHQDNAGPGRGRGFGRGRMMPPAGRAIQVEGGGGERRPSADVRRQRSRDSDAIVLHDASEDDPPTPAAGNEGSEEYQEDEERAAAPGKERRFYRNAPSGPWDMDGPPSTWERENMPMGVGMMNLHGGGMMAGHRIDGEGPPGPFPIVPAMPMHQPGPNFGMFPGTGFRPPPVGRAGIVRPPLYNGPRPGLPLPILGPPPENFPAVMLPHDYHEPSRRRTPPHLTPPRRTPPRRTPPRRTPPRRTTPSVGHPADWDDELSNGSGANWNVREGRSHRETRDGGSGNQHTDEVEGREGSHLERRGRDNDRVSLRERSVDEGSVDGRSEERKRSSSREHRVEENDWDDGPSLRVLKKPKLQSQVDIRAKSEREDFSQPKALKSSVRREDPNHNWEASRDRVLLEEDVSQERRHDSLHKASDRKGPPHREESQSSQRKETGWIDRADEELKDRRQLREREEVQRRKAREDDVRHRRNRDEMERERRRDDIERERRHLRKEKEEERFPQDDRLKRNMESVPVSREREDSRARDVKSMSMEREAEHGREKRKREEDRVKLKSRLDDFREPEGRLKGRVEDLRESDGRGKARLNERRENDGRHKGRFEGLRENDGRAKGRLDEFRDDGRGKIKVEDGREGEARLKGRIDDARENDGRGKGWLEDGRNSDGRGKVRHDDVRESAGRARGQLEDARENVVRGRSRLEDPRETDGRGKSLLSGKGRQEDLRDTDGKMYSRIENLSESHGRMPAWGDHVKENDSGMKRRHEDTREITGKSRNRQEDGREGEERSEVWAVDVREADGRAKRRAEDSRDFDRLVSLPDDGRQRTARTRGHVEDHRDTELKGKLHPDEGRISDGRSRRYEKEDETHSWEDRRKHEEQSSRGDGSHASWSQSAEKRKVVDELWQQKEKRGWERNATNKESLSERNGALSGFAEDKSYRSRMDGSKKRRVEEYRASDQFDKASTRDPVELASSNARHKEKKMVIPKRIDDSFERRKRGKDASSRQNRVGRDDDNSLPPDNGSSEEESERKGRSKLERWTSKKERDAAANASGEALLKWDFPDSGREKPSSTSQHGVSKRKQQSRGKPHWKEEQKERQRVTAPSGKREFYPEEKERDTVLDAPASVPKDAAETRKERLERLKLQREEEAARRQKNETSILHTGSVEEVKQERPARKRRWGNG